MRQIILKAALRYLQHFILKYPLKRSISTKHFKSIKIGADAADFYFNIMREATIFPKKIYDTQKLTGLAPLVLTHGKVIA
jgi:hypothetical protein